MDGPDCDDVVLCFGLTLRGVLLSTFEHAARHVHFTSAGPVRGLLLEMCFRCFLCSVSGSIGATPIILCFGKVRDLIFSKLHWTASQACHFRAGCFTRPVHLGGVLEQTAGRDLPPLFSMLPFRVRLCSRPVLAKSQSSRFSMLRLAALKV